MAMELQCLDGGAFLAAEHAPGFATAALQASNADADDLRIDVKRPSPLQVVGVIAAVVACVGFGLCLIAVVVEQMRSSENLYYQWWF